MSRVDRALGSPLLQPLRTRDYRLLVFGALVSLLGDGFYFVALAWQVYDISNVPTALSIVSAAAAIPMVGLLLVGGALSDRFDRRLLMIGADLLRAGAIGTMAVLSIAGVIELGHIVVLVLFVGAGHAFFNPASTAILPDLLEERQLPAANALAGVYRPIVLRLAGPALAGLVVAVGGSGWAFAFDAATFVVSAIAVAMIRARPARRPSEDHRPGRMLRDVREGLGYVRSQPWIWATLVAAMLSLLVFIGPLDVLVPYLVRNRLQLGPDSLGAIFAAGGVGGIVMAVLIGNLGQPRRRVTVMYAAWSGGVALMAVYGVMTELWQALLASAVVNALFELGSVIWMTLLQQRVPRELLGRVSSVDWLMSSGLTPISFALTGPAAAAFGPEATIIGASLAGAVLMGALLFVPGVRDPERVEAAPAEDPAAARRPTGPTGSPGCREGPRGGRRSRRA
ncbi:MAG TPA: MFS transporter [Candidatus Binatia bacterium]|nr:MFS transporter [Candidatus Binatia bacterium]